MRPGLVCQSILHGNSLVPRWKTHGKEPHPTCFRYDPTRTPTLMIDLQMRTILYKSFHVRTSLLSRRYRLKGFGVTQSSQGLERGTNSSPKPGRPCMLRTRSAVTASGSAAPLGRRWSPRPFAHPRAPVAGATMPTPLWVATHVALPPSTTTAIVAAGPEAGPRGDAAARSRLHFSKAADLRGLFSVYRFAAQTRRIRHLRRCRRTYATAPTIQIDRLFVRRVARSTGPESPGWAVVPRSRQTRVLAEAQWGGRHVQGAPPARRRRGLVARRPEGLRGRRVSTAS